MKLQIKTLSPIHIGNGEKYNGLSYVEDIFSTPKRVFVMNFDRIKTILNQKDLQSFMDWVVSEKYPSWFKFCKSELNKPQLLNEFKKVAIYTLNNYSAERNLRDIDCFIKQNNRPYIPGTEIKGAIRTAIAYHLLGSNENYVWLKKQLLELQNKFRNTFLILSSCGRKGNSYLSISELKQIQKEELKRLFGEKRLNEITKKIRHEEYPKIRINDIKNIFIKEVGKIEENLQNKLFRVNNNSDAKYDLLKVFQVGDSELKDPFQCLFVSSMKVENTKKRDTQGNLTDIILFQELCTQDQIFTCQFSQLENNRTNRTVLDKLGFTPEQKWVVSDIENVFQCCYQFTDRLLREEIDYFTNLNKPQIITMLHSIKHQNTPTSPAIRIGKNEGYFSITMGLLVKDKDKTLYDNILCHATKNTSYTGNFPKTRRVVNLLNNKQDTLGWVKLIVENEK
ncbi:MAG: type III-A CRISPR-associated RAMP protein Csm5 [Candidatus Brocadia sp.]|nr:type III-A CRISPR-associated RAMP protein Csm5 [Candidatus Brocadia sp.]